MGIVKDITGQRFNKLVAIKQVDKPAHINNRSIYWLFQCDCGNTAVLNGSAVRFGNTTSCGCHGRSVGGARNFDDLSGLKVGKLTVNHRAEDTPSGNTRWWATCECGTFKRYPAYELKHGRPGHCGCNRGNITTMPEYKVWQSMKKRCEKLYSRNESYIARGIKVCDRWINSFDAFIADMGNRPSNKHCIDRINNDLGYSPDNCRWVLPIVNANNRSTNVTITYKGETRTMTEWARHLGYSKNGFKYRIKNWSIEDAFNKPKHK